MPVNEHGANKFPNGTALLWRIDSRFFHAKTQWMNATDFCSQFWLYLVVVVAASRSNAASPGAASLKPYPSHSISCSLFPNSGYRSLLAIALVVVAIVVTVVLPHHIQARHYVDPSCVCLHLFFCTRSTCRSFGAFVQHTIAPWNRIKCSQSMQQRWRYSLSLPEMFGFDWVWRISERIGGGGGSSIDICEQTHFPKITKLESLFVMV